MTFLLAQADAMSVAGPDVMPSLTRTFGALAVVLALIAGLAWLLKRGLLNRRSAKGLGVEALLPLGERRSLAIVTVEGRRLLVGLAPSAVTLVTELQGPPSFDQTLKAATAAETRPA